MNRIVLVGNGFDLAHGLQTRYEDFVNWYWEQWGKRLIHSDKKLVEDELYSFKLKSELGGWYLVWGFHYNLLPREYPKSEIVNLLKSDTDTCEIKEKSIFFNEICRAIETKNWVDIENEYYKFLCSFLAKSQYDNPHVLNRELDFIKSKLIEYLTSVQEEHIQDLHLNDNVRQKIFSPFTSKDISINSGEIWIDFLKRRYELSQGQWKNLLSNYNESDVHDRLCRINSFKEKYGELIKSIGIKIVPEEEFPEEFLLPDRIVLLNFNYTSIADAYFPKANCFTVNHIHGELSKPESVIFGYGDESDEGYEELLKLDENEYLRNMKTIRYSESDNYRHMLSFIESAPFQVYIMGHSCGNSDRTLLNTLFEHKNCVSIKPFYHQKEDGLDNYLDIVQNICRNFTDMKLMRDRVVNKTFCTSLSS